MDFLYERYKCNKSHLSDLKSYSIISLAPDITRFARWEFLWIKSQSVSLPDNQQ